MATQLQKNLATEIVKDVEATSKGKKPRKGKDLLVSAGYDETTALATPGRTIESKGVIKALNDLGFSIDGAKKVVASILYDEGAKDRDRLEAADKVFKVHGAYIERHENLNVNVQVKPRAPKVVALAQEFEQKLKNEIGAGEGEPRSVDHE